MASIVAKCGETGKIGYQTENNRTQVRFPLADVISEFPGGTATLVIQRAGDAQPVASTNTEMDGTDLVWTVSAWECERPGFLYAQIIYAVTEGEVVAKTKIYRFTVKESLLNAAEEPDSWENWVGELVQAAAGVNDAIAAAMDTLDGKVADAEAAQTAAETAQGKAEDAQTAAETAQGAAETAQGKAEDAQTAAETAQTAAETAQGKAEDAQTAAESAQSAAESARSGAVSAKAAAEAAAQAAAGIIDDTAGAGVTNKTWSADQLAASSSLTEPLTRVISLDATELACGTPIESVGTPVYVDDVTDYPTYNLTDTGWYLFARISAKAGVTVTAQTTVTGAAGSVITAGADHVDVAVRFEVAAISKKVTVTWETGNAESFVFKATDLAVRNLDYRTTFYVYDIARYRTWTYALTTDTAFVTGSRYFTESGGIYTEAIEGTDWTAGDTIPANTYYKHSKLTFAGMIRNVTYRLNEMVDCPIEISLPTVPDDGYGAWFEIQMQFNAQYSITLVPTDETVKIGTAATQSLTAGINVVDLTYSAVNGIKMWTLLNTHSNLPTA